MDNQFNKIETAIEYLDIAHNFILYTTYYRRDTGKPLLLGMHLSFKKNFVTENAQTCNYFRSVLRKFGNDQLQKIPPNDFFSIEQRTVENETHKSLLCKFYEYEKVYIDAVEAHAITQTIDSILNRYEIGRLVFDGRIFFLSQIYEKIDYRFSEPKEDESISPWLKLPSEVNYFLRRIVKMERG